MVERVTRIALFLAGSLASYAFVAGAQEPAKAQATPQQKQRDGAAATYRITGRVVNALTRAPVASAYVTISASSSSDSSHTVRTDADGGFVLGQILAGSYVMTARRKGYVEQMYLQHEFFTTAVLVGPN